MTNKLKYLILFILFLPLRGLAQPCINDSALIPVDSTVRIGHLSNGLTYYIKYNNWPENRASFYLAQRVGSLQEEDNQRGLAHFLEHMCFNGSEHFPGNRVDSFFESMGANDGGRRSITSTTSRQPSVKRNLTVACWCSTTGPTDSRSTPLRSKRSVA